MKFEICEKTRKSPPVFVCSQEMHDKLRKLGYTTPTLITGYGAFYYACDRAPTASEPDCYTDIPDFLEIWWDQTNEEFYFCSDNTSGAMVWNHLTTNINLPTQLSSLGITSASVRSRSSRTSPAFATSYQPSTTNDMEVNAIINFNALLAFSFEVHFQVSTDGVSWDDVVIIKDSLSIGANKNINSTFTVPISCYYRAEVVSGNPSYISIVFFKELSK